MKRIVTMALCLLMGLPFVMAQVNLSFNPNKGVKYRYANEISQDIKQTVMGQEMDIKMKITMGYDMSLIEKSAEEMKVGFLYTDIYYEVTSPMANMKYDSKNPTTGGSVFDDIMAKIFNAMIGQQMDAVILPDGTVKSVTGMEAITAAMMANLGDDAMGKQVGEGMKQQFNDEMMRKSFEQSMKVYANKPLKVGDTYEVNQSTTTSGFTIDIVSTYKLASVDKKYAYMDVQSTLTGMDGKLNGGQNGTMQFDLKTGLPVSSKLNQKFSGTISTQGMEIPLSADSNIIVSIETVK